jgi:radical SAM-linked protein
MRAFTRALRRAQMPVQHSQGLHPQPQLNFATALPVGVESTGEYADVVLFEPVEPGRFQAALNAVLPDYMHILDAATVPLKMPSLMSEPLAARYDIDVPVHLVPDGAPSPAARVQALLARDDIPMQRWHKKGPRQVNIRPGIVSLEVLPVAADTVTVELLAREEPAAKAKPLEVIQALFELNDDELSSVRIYKQESFVRDATGFIPILQHRPHVVLAHEVPV